MKKKIDPSFKAYLELVRTLMRKRSVSRDARSVWMYLSTYENFKTNTAQPGIRTICRELLMSPNTLGKLLDELAAAGLVLFSSTPKKNGQLNVYTLIAPQPDSPSSAETGGNLVPFPSQNSTNSTPSTTPSGGNSAFIAGTELQRRPLSQG